MLSAGRDLLWGKLGLFPLGLSMLCKSLIQFSVDGWDCVPSLFGLRPNYGGFNVDNGDLFKKVLYPSPGTCSISSLTHTSARVSWILTGCECLCYSLLGLQS